MDAGESRGPGLPITTQVLALTAALNRADPKAPVIDFHRTSQNLGPADLQFPRTPIAPTPTSP